MRERFLAINSKAELRENLIASLEASDDPALLRELRCPTLLMVGDDDFTAPTGAMRAMLGLIGKGRVDVLRECGHLPYFEAVLGQRRPEPVGDPGGGCEDHRHDGAGNPHIREGGSRR